MRPSRKRATVRALIAPINGIRAANVLCMSIRRHTDKGASLRGEACFKSAQQQEAEVPTEDVHQLGAHHVSKLQVQATRA